MQIPHKNMNSAVDWLQSLFDYSVFDYREFLKIASTKKLSLSFEVFIHDLV